MICVPSSLLYYPSCLHMNNISVKSYILIYISYITWFLLFCIKIHHRYYYAVEYIEKFIASKMHYHLPRNFLTNEFTFNGFHLVSNSFIELYRIYLYTNIYTQHLLLNALFMLIIFFSTFCNFDLSIECILKHLWTNLDFCRVNRKCQKLLVRLVHNGLFYLSHMLMDFLHPKQPVKKHYKAFDRDFDV